MPASLNGRLRNYPKKATNAPFSSPSVSSPRTSPLHPGSVLRALPPRPGRSSRHPAGRPRRPASPRSQVHPLLRHHPLSHHPSPDTGCGKSRRLLPGHLHLHRPLRRNRPRRPRGQRSRRQHRRRALVGPRLPSRRKDALGEAFTLGRIHPRSARLRRTRRRHAPQRHQPTPGRPHRHLPDARRALWPAPERRPPGPEPRAPP